MKNIFAYTLLFMFVIGCTDNKQQHSIDNSNLEIGSALMDGTTEMTPIIVGETSNQEIWIKYIQAHNDKNLDIIAKINSEDWEGYTADGSVVEGKKEHIEIVEKWYKKANQKWKEKGRMDNAGKNKDGV